MEIVREDNRLRLYQDGEAVGKLDYGLNGTQMVINHVGVDPAFRGQGLAKKLVDAAVNLAREEGWKIVPVCPYAVAVLQRDKSAQDVLA